MKHLHLSDGDTFTHEGQHFRAKFEHDETSGMPWDESDGHGPVRKSTTRHSQYRSSNKRPGERPLNSPDRNGYQFYYDWQAATKTARKAGWNAEPYDAPNRVQRAVQADYDFLRAFLNDDWQYVGVTVERIQEDADGEIIVMSEQALWGVETWKNYHVEMAYELAGELVSEARAAWRDALAMARTQRKADKAEAVEAHYWAMRDVVTVQEVQP